MKTQWFILILICIKLSFLTSIKANSGSYSGYPVTKEGAWCWFADPRAIHYSNPSGTINKSYIGYIDVHGNIKAMQYDFEAGIKDEVLVRSYFQPDDHNNPTFLVLPDERIMIFYSRHTDEHCFYYRVSEEPGDITTLGKEYRLETDHATTYPSPFILSNDPGHIYLCWRGMEWHPTMARLVIPDREGYTEFDWGPKQIVRYSTDGIQPKQGSRPYAKYSSNGKDKIYMAYTTTHPDNENPNWLHFNYIHIPFSQNASEIMLTDVKGKKLSIIDSEVHIIQKTQEYLSSYPDAIVDHPDSCRNWVWEVTEDKQGNPIIAMTRINGQKDSHDYYCAKWIGQTWDLTFLENGGGHFHQSPDIEKCYSGGMAIDKDNPHIIYCSVPIHGEYGKVYEIKKYTIGKDGEMKSSKQITWNSHKNNVRPYVLSHSAQSSLRLTWMHGDYYDWIVSSIRSQGYPTSIHCDFNLSQDNIDIEKGLIHNNDAGLKHQDASSFSLLVSLSFPPDSYGGELLQIGTFCYGIDKESLKPYIREAANTHYSTNKLASSDVWRTKPRGTGGEWYDPTKFHSFHLAFVYDLDTLTVYVNGLIDQKVKISNLTLDKLKFVMKPDDYRIYDRKLMQDEIKILGADRFVPDISYIH